MFGVPKEWHSFCCSAAVARWGRRQKLVNGMRNRNRMEMEGSPAQVKKNGDRDGEGNWSGRPVESLLCRLQVCKEKDQSAQIIRHFYAAASCFFLNDVTFNK